MFLLAYLKANYIVILSVIPVENVLCHTILNVKPLISILTYCEST